MKPIKTTPNSLRRLGFCLFILTAIPDRMQSQTATTPTTTSSAATAPSAEDTFLWLEEVANPRSLGWVKAQNARSTNELEALPSFEPTRQRLLAILDSKERIPYAVKHGVFFYNFWRDEKHPRGIWRRATLAEYKKENPAWETVLDLDGLGRSEKTNWVWKGYDILQPGYDRCLVLLSRGGADAVVIREFDLATKEFIPDGFILPEAKTSVTWRSRDEVYFGTDFGPGSLTHSGYPRIVKSWKRGAAWKDAATVFEGKPEDVSVGASVVHDHGRVYEFIGRRVTFFSGLDYLRRGEEWVRIEKPDDADLSTFDDQLLLKLRSDWRVNGKMYSAGALLSVNLEAYLKGDRALSTLFQPTDRTSLEGFSATKHYLILNELDNVRSKIHLLRRGAGSWERTTLEVPAFGAASAGGIDPDESDDYFLNLTGFLTPSSLYYGTLGGPEREKLKSLPEFFDSRDLEVGQFEAVSKDGVKVPYFQVARRGVKLDGGNPTLLYGYGGFEISMLPSYSAGVGSAWLEKGGIYALANIRGGGEFGPKWHESARKANRQRAYNDFIAVAESLIARKVTSPSRLGIQGGSNGGLLMGVMVTERPDLFKAVVCMAPLLDMRRYNKLLAGASWMDEYGDPDKPAEWAYIQKYSPYQNVFPGRKYPRVLFTTSTRDDRVHPGHARKLAAKMESQGHDVLFYENTEGGHAGSADNKQAAFMSALAYTFLAKELGLSGK